MAEANAILNFVPKDVKPMKRRLFLIVFDEEWTNGVSRYELAVLFEASCFASLLDAEADGPPVVCVVARPEALPVDGDASHSG